MLMGGTPVLPSSVVKFSNQFWNCFIEERILPANSLTDCQCGAAIQRSGFFLTVGGGGAVLA